jgi:hypothetical protein
VLLGGALVFLLFPKHEDEERLLAEYAATDSGQGLEDPGATT